MTHLLQPISVYQEAISYAKAEKENKKIHAKEKIKERCRQVAEELESDVARTAETFQSNAKALKERLDQALEKQV